MKKVDRVAPVLEQEIVAALERVGLHTLSSYARGHFLLGGTVDQLADKLVFAVQVIRESAK